MTKKKTKKVIPKSVVITAILAVAGLELAAISQGINGQLLRIVIGAICLLAGVTLPQMKLK